MKVKDKIIVMFIFFVFGQNAFVSNCAVAFCFFSVDMLTAPEMTVHVSNKHFIKTPTTKRRQSQQILFWNKQRRSWSRLRCPKSTELGIVWAKVIYQRKCLAFSLGGQGNMV
jgi:hypothetical protein